ncbi:hypothetical protein HL666_20560 [Bradyrhizobium sp. 83002]|uniref:hypothetical protein n=1 Tax=Bradyrhizobium aeschynomenes TaxID=2734909 RepID=UPI001552AC05|nr:hypothetical protein [Bradyrhizobium aeschynomenes]NPU13164.1 hypothetical protein [Bradyrhizobium aeschynomenes]
MLDVYCYTGLRRGDAARVGKQHVHNETISLATEKSQGQTAVHIPVLDVLKRTLDAGPTGELTFIVTEKGTPTPRRASATPLKRQVLLRGS